MASYDAIRTLGEAVLELMRERCPLADLELTSSAAFKLASYASLAGAEKQSAALMAGGADPHSVIQALAAAELAVETAVVIRDKVVEAYQEILRMPV